MGCEKGPSILAIEKGQNWLVPALVQDSARPHPILGKVLEGLRAVLLSERVGRFQTWFPNAGKQRAVLSRSSEIVLAQGDSRVWADKSWASSPMDWTLPYLPRGPESNPSSFGAWHSLVGGLSRGFSVFLSTLFLVLMSHQPQCNHNVLFTFFEDSLSVDLNIQTDLCEVSKNGELEMIPRDSRKKAKLNWRWK